MKSTNNATLTKAIQQGFRVMLAEELHTSLPGRITKYDSATRKATVLPLIKKKFLDGEELQFEPISDVPVMFYGVGESGIRLPESQFVGQTVLLIFAERSLDYWLSTQSTEPIIPGNTRKFSLTDAIALLSVNKFTDGDDGGDNLELFWGNNAVRIKKNGDIEIDGGNKITIKSNGDIEIGSTALRKLITDDLIALYNAHTHSGVTTGPGVTGPPAIPLTSAIATLKTKAE